MADSAALPTGFRRASHDSLGSTNAEALVLARAGDPGQIWITAHEQTAGRGRRGRAWSAGHGNLAGSLLLLDPTSTSSAATISFVAGVALYQAVIDVCGPAIADRLALKWPNDLLLDQCKVAGILVEGEKLPGGMFATIVGFGVNCVSHPDIDAPIPPSNFRARGVPVETETLFSALARSMAVEVSRLDRGAGFAAIRAAWLARACGVGDAIRVNLDGRSIDGRFEDLDGDGRLILKRNDGVRETFTAGDVFFPTTA